MSYPDELKRNRTPGPWECEGLTIRGEHPKQNGRSRIVAECVIAPGTWAQEADGNARLIAAAPQLLEACEKARASELLTAELDDLLEAAIRAAREG